MVDFGFAFLFALLLTVGFAAAVRTRGYRRLIDMSWRWWLMLLVSWAFGIWVVGLAPVVMGTHWATFAALGFLGGALLVILGSYPRARAALQAGPNTHDGASVVALYFCITLLLFFCAVSVRFYVVNLA